MRRARAWLSPWVLLGVVGIALTLAMGYAMFREEIHKNDIAEAETAARDFTTQAEAFSKAARKQIRKSANSNDVEKVSKTITTLRADAPRLAKVSDYAAEHTFDYRQAAELEQRMRGKLKSLDTAVADARIAQKFTRNARKALELRPSIMLQGADRIDGNTVRERVASPYEEALEGLDVQRLAKPYRSQGAKVRDAVAVVHQQALDIAKSLDAGTTKSFDFNAEYVRAYRALESLESKYKERLGKALATAFE